MSSSDGGITWTATLTPDAPVEDTSNLITLASGSVFDLASNPNSGSTNSNNYAIDTVAPTVVISGIDISADTGTSSADFLTKTAAQTITGTVLGTAISWAGATLSGSSSIQFKVTDAASNDGTVANQSYVLDTTAPTDIIWTASTSWTSSETSLPTGVIATLSTSDPDSVSYIYTEVSSSPDVFSIAGNQFSTTGLANNNHFNT